MSVKIGLVKCLSSTDENLRQEVKHTREALKINNYPDKLVRKYVGKCKNKTNNVSSDSDNNNNNNSNINDNMHVKHAQDNDNTKIENISHQ
ncbi:unnamed protein product [Trichobilharzia regenti]|nr:unnamed protein product [Trichobilharzia regenti]